MKVRSLLATRRRFTRVEIELVRRNYADSLAADLSTVTGLSEPEIHRLARRLGVRKVAPK